MSPFAIGFALALLTTGAAGQVMDDPGPHEFCAVPSEDQVNLAVSGYVTGGGRVSVSWPGAQCTLDIFNSNCNTARVPRNAYVEITFSPEMTWSGPDRIFYGIYAMSSNGSCDLRDSAVESPLRCRLWSGDGVTLELYVPRCTRQTGWRECR